MGKPNHLLDHITDPEFRDDRDRLVVTANPDRLSLFYGGGRGDWGTVARYVAGPARWPVKWFPDANVAFLPQTEGVWDALRVAALTSHDSSTVVTEVVEQEMREWLIDPYRHRERAAAIRAAMDERTWIKRYGIGRSGPLALAVLGYTHLLGVRRLLARPCPDGTTLLNTDPADKGGTMTAIRNAIGERAVGLAKKGRNDAERKGAVGLGDELHCLSMIAYALTHRRDAVLLTADRDLLEIFYKVQWFIDTHYRAWLAARMVAAGQYGTPAGELVDTDGYFRGPVTLYRRPTGQLQEVLPSRQRPVRAGVLYVSPDGMLHKMVFPFEPAMLDLLITRGTTDGRCTDLFGDSNLHVHLGPLTRQLDGRYLGIGPDAVSTFEYDGVTSRVARLDLEHSINCVERFAR